MSLRSRIRERLAAHEHLAVWGACGLGRTAMRFWLPNEKVSLVVDANAKPSLLLGKFAVILPGAADLSGISCVVICTAAHITVLRDLRALGFTGPRFLDRRK